MADWKGKVFLLMQERNMTQKQLSQLSGISESSMSRYLHSNKKPRIDILVNIAKALHVETDYLLDDEEKSESAYNAIATAIARKGSELTPEEKNRLIALILGQGKDV
jgi:transcriptional regulator with XRE-family HTH domain